MGKEALSVGIEKREGKACALIVGRREDGPPENICACALCMHVLRVVLPDQLLKRGSTPGKGWVLGAGDGGGQGTTERWFFSLLGRCLSLGPKGS